MRCPKCKSQNVNIAMNKYKHALCQNCGHSWKVKSKHTFAENPKNIIYSILVVAAVIAVIIAVILGPTDDSIESLTIEDDNDINIDFELSDKPNFYYGDKGEPYYGEIIVSPLNVRKENIEILSDNDKIIDVTIESYYNGILSYSITPKFNGEVRIHAQTKDGEIVSNYKKFIVSGGYDLEVNSHLDGVWTDGRIEIRVVDIKIDKWLYSQWSNYNEGYNDERKFLCFKIEVKNLTNEIISFGVHSDDYKLEYIAGNSFAESVFEWTDAYGKRIGEWMPIRNDSNTDTYYDNIIGVKIDTAYIYNSVINPNETRVFMNAFVTNKESIEEYAHSIQISKMRERGWFSPIMIM